MSSSQAPSPADIRLPESAARALPSNWCAQVSAAMARADAHAQDGSGRLSGVPVYGALATMLVDWHQRRDPSVKAQLINTLDEMAPGVLSAPTRSGFARLAADPLRPPVDKTLYDNAQLVPLYAEAAQAFGRADYAGIARETCASVDGALTGAHGGVGAARDDDRVIASQNALMVRAWAIAGRTLGEPTFVEAAQRTARFIEQELVVEGRLQHRWRDGRTSRSASVDDLAAVSLAFVDLFEATGEPAWLARAAHRAEELWALFRNPTDGSLHRMSGPAASLSVRSEPPPFEGEPGAHGQAALALARLAVFTGRTELGAHADAILAERQPLLERNPRSLGLEGVAAAWRTSPARELAVLGARQDTEALHAELRRRHLPLLALAAVSPEKLDEAARLVPWLANRGVRPGHAKAYLCEGHRCQLPATTARQLAAQLDGPL